MIDKKKLVEWLEERAIEDSTIAIMVGQSDYNNFSKRPEITKGYIDTLFKINEGEFNQIPAKWIPVTNGRGGHECSACHYYAPSFQSGVEWLSPYCPKCGAITREELIDIE